MGSSWPTGMMVNERSQNIPCCHQELLVSNKISPFPRRPQLTVWNAHWQTWWANVRNESCKPHASWISSLVQTEPPWIHVVIPDSWHGLAALDNGRMAISGQLTASVGLLLIVFLDIYRNLRQKGNNLSQKQIIGNICNITVESKNKCLNAVFSWFIHMLTG